MSGAGARGHREGERERKPNISLNTTIGKKIKGALKK